MSNLKFLRNKIKSVTSTQKITRAMQMVAASKLKSLKALSYNAKYCNEAIANVVTEAARYVSVEDTSSRLSKIALGGMKSKKTLIIAVTSERGLCGGFNISLLRTLKADLAKTETELAVIGKKGIEWASVNCANFKAFHLSKSLAEDSYKICEFIISRIEEEDFGSVQIYFNKFKNTTMQIPSVQKLMPLSINGLDSSADNELEGENLLDRSIKLYIASSIYLAITESRVGEEASRMVAMDSATNNAQDMIQSLTLTLNRTRQASITKELIEIISGSEAMN